AARPGDPYPFQGGTNPYTALLERWSTEGPRAMPRAGSEDGAGELLRSDDATFDEAFTRGTTSIQAADKNGWMVSITPSGGWVPAVIAGRTGIGLSQRMQSFV